MLPRHLPSSALCADAHPARRQQSRIQLLKFGTGEMDMSSISDKIFGVAIGSAIFFGVGIALAHAAVIG